MLSEINQRKINTVQSHLYVQYEKSSSHNQRLYQWLPGSGADWGDGKWWEAVV